MLHKVSFMKSLVNYLSTLVHFLYTFGHLKCDISDYDEECIIIGDGGVANIKIDKKFSCSDHNYIIKSKYNKYIYYYLINNIKLLEDGFKGSALKNISKSFLNDLKIPIPKTDEKINYWIEKLSLQYNLYLYQI